MDICKEGRKSGTKRKSSMLWLHKLFAGSGLNSLVEDKEIASRAVAFVINSTRKGIVSLCTDVANLLRAKRSLEKKVLLLKKENEALRSGSRPTSYSTSPTPASLSLDRSLLHDISYHIHMDVDHEEIVASTSGTNFICQFCAKRYQHQNS